MLMGGFSVGRFLGFRIRIDYSWFVVLALVTWTFSRWQFPQDLPGLSGPTYLARVQLDRSLGGTTGGGCAPSRGRALSRGTSVAGVLGRSR